MISKSAITSPGGAAGYYTSTQAAAEYYSGEQVPSAWAGGAAAALGLQGKVDPDTLTRILEGRVIHRDPKTGEPRERQLGRTITNPETGEKEVQHRAGWDFTISAPKSVSLQALVHGDKATLAAHRAAAAEALSYLERHASQTRLKSGEFTKTDGLAVATFEHLSSRAGDPQLHTHALIANVTTLDGKAYSLSNEKLFEHRRAADAVYHSALARELQLAGHEVKFDREGRVELAAYSPEQLKDFSTRAQEIEKALTDRGLTRDTASSAQRDMLALATRHDKNLPETREAHLSKWQAQAAALGVEPAQATAADRLAAKSIEALGGGALARQAVDAAKSHLTEREAVFKTSDLHMQAARFSQGRVTQAEMEKEIARQQKAGEIISQGDRHTTHEARQNVEYMKTALESGKGEHQAVMRPHEFDHALAKFEERKGFALSDEQRAAARMILTGDDRYQGVQGLAGTGKTTLLSFVREAAESKGWTVNGHSNGSEQAAVMQKESGIVSTTTASHLIEQRKELAEQNIKPDHIAAPKRELRIMDEAGQAGQKEFNQALLTTAQSGARTVFLGDSRQHQSVEAGRAFEQAQRHMPVAQLGEASIRRQTTTHMKAAVSDILAKRESDALKKINTLEIAPARSSLRADAPAADQRTARQADNAAVIQQIAKDYASLPAEQRGKTLVLTATNADRKAINQAIRAELKATGALVAGAEVQTLRKADMTRPESRRAENYRPGQVVQIGKECGPLPKGAQLEVTAADSRTNTLKARDAQGKEHTIHPAQTPLQAYNREQREFSPGDRIKFTENHTLSDCLKVRNGQAAEVARVSDRHIHLRVGEGKNAAEIAVPRGQALKAEHAYVSTSHAAQGQTVNKVFIHHNTEAGRHGDRETYVNITRARQDATLYTQDTAKASKQAGAALQKTSALDIAKPHDGLSNLISPTAESSKQPQAAKTKEEKTHVRERVRESGMTH